MVQLWKIYVGFLAFLMIRETIKSHLSSFLPFLLCIAYFLFVVSVGLGEY